MNILIAGGTGFIGKNLTQRLVQEGHHVFILTRHTNSYQNNTNITYLDYSTTHLSDIHVFINLAGDSLFGYWTKKKKSRILSSRINTTRQLINYIKQFSQKPNLLINASAVGFYGTSEEKIFSEKTTTPGNDFLASVVKEWEKEAMNARLYGVRTVLLRLGIVLGPEGALPMMKLPAILGFGGKIGHGEQWMSWIHIEDVVSLILFCIENQAINGPVNATAPHPVRHQDFMKTLAKVLNRPYWLPVPASMIRLLMGDMSDLILKGQYVLPEKALQHGFEFSYPTIKKALKASIN